ncbi:MAG: 30S ribosomal protein S6 [Firmicutes bacterium]|nr:30S ribosomal protein S6 [Bacillota bacterium]
MKEYEGVFIIDPEPGEDGAEIAIAKIEKIISKHKGKVEKKEKLEKRSLAYEIKKRREGYYFSIDFNAPPKAIDELKKSYNLEDSILRHLILCKDEG